MTIPALTPDVLLIVLVAIGVLSLIVGILAFRRAGARDLVVRIEGLAHDLERIEPAVRDELSTSRRESNETAKLQRDEAARSMNDFRSALLDTISKLSELQKGQLEGFAKQLGQLQAQSEQKAEALRLVVEERLDKVRTENAAKLEEMRQTVDEKLQGTLEKRLGESFKQVSERLEQVHKGLGEMQSLATGVGDLKRVMTNVKTRGTWGEYQLGAILEQILSPEQYERNVATKPESGERVEYAIRLPGPGEDVASVVYLPIDAKFPSEDYQRLLDAQEAADVDALNAAAKQLDTAIKLSARDICDKYIAPPGTTDFGIMFLPTEGLYAEVIRRTGLVEHCQRECRVVIAGPTTLAALLNSLQMGFRTLAIQKRSSEVWEILSAVKSEFGKFGDVLGKVKKKLQEASNTVETVEKRTRVMGKTLRDVEALPVAPPAVLLGLGGDTGTEANGGADTGVDCHADTDGDLGEAEDPTEDAEKEAES